MNERVKTLMRCRRPGLYNIKTCKNVFCYVNSFMYGLNFQSVEGHPVEGNPRQVHGERFAEVLQNQIPCLGPTAELHLRHCAQDPPLFFSWFAM